MNLQRLLIGHMCAPTIVEKEMMEQLLRSPKSVAA